MNTGLKIESNEQGNNYKYKLLLYLWDESQLGVSVAGYEEVVEEELRPVYDDEELMELVSENDDVEDGGDEDEDRMEDDDDDDDDDEDDEDGENYEGDKNDEDDDDEDDEEEEQEED
ncbi:phosphopantothenoylcysteine decarboxylase subunit VHS3-like [Apis florea]|uniref:phosphopantothenoylcysteine decarboxylase subunit VHS3-like n=1 Tax=Apis florea TaxID=7463 RepID=UPI0012FF39C9|nr:phosphopantothenoylcysteine decarboxylase subunit VHS3-like [Apis florea]